MSSLTDEIGKLFELHKAGALTAEEFARAKEAVLQRFAPSAVQNTPQAASTSIAVPSAPPTTTAYDTSSNAEVVPIISADDAAAQSVSNASPTVTASSAAFEPVPLPQAQQQQYEQPPVFGVDEPTDYDEARARFPHIALHELLSHATDVNSDALRCTAALQQLERIVSNLKQHPHEPKYRRLRLHNPTLASTLFAVPGCSAVLESLGFRRLATMANQSSAGEQSSATGSEAVGEEQLVLPDSGDVAHTDVPFAALLEEALAALDYVRATMAAARRRQDEVRQLRRGVVFSIRVERALQARAEGRLVPFLVECYANDVAGDELHTALNHLQRLEQVLRKAHEQPRTATYRRLWLHNPVVFRAFVQQPGGLEALVGLVNGTLQDGSGSTGTCIVLDPDNTAQPDNGNSSSSSSSGVVAAEGVSGHNSGVSLEEALRAVGEVRRGVEALREERRQAARRAAEEAIRTERRRERRRMMHHHDVEQSRLEALMSDFTRRTRTERREDGDTSDSSDDDEQQESRRGAAGSGRRVPIAEALAILLGKSRDKD